MKKKPKPLYRRKNLQSVTTSDYIAGMKTKEPMILTDGDHETRAMVVREFHELPGVGHTISVRAAKAHLSGLLEEVAGGREIVITSDGTPKARLVPMTTETQRKPFLGTREHLKKMPPWRGGPTADEIVREDRDGRGW